MTRNIAIIGASYLQVPLIKKAKELGYVTHVFAWETGDIGEREADFFYPISIVEKEAIAQKCKDICICGICSIASDLATITVNYVADKLGLNGNSLECTKKSTNKHLMRLCFKENNDPSPYSVLVDHNTQLETISFDYPLIIKPTDRSGSRAINVVKNINEMKEAVKKAISESFEKKALIEEYVEGDEYSVEGISFKGEHYILAITKKKTTGSPHFIETKHTEPSGLDVDVQNRLKAIVKHALCSLDITNSASHSEVKIDKNGNIKIIEIGARMGGDCIGSDLVYYSTGIDYVKAVIQVACNEKPDLEPKRKPKTVSSCFILNENDLDEFNKIINYSADRIIRVAYINKELIGRTSNSSDRAGCYIVIEEDNNLK